MNANELADMIDSDNWVGMDDQEHIEWEMKAATMLRQQQAEIEALKSCELTDEEIIDCVKKAGFQFVNNEVVMYPTWTDAGEKLLLLKPNFEGTLADGLKSFAKEILRKAQKNERK